MSEQGIANPGLVQKVSGWFCLALGAVVMVTTGLMVARAYLPLPLFDQWAELTARDHLQHLFSLHNEHLLFLPRLLYLVDKGFGGTNVFNETMTFVIQLCEAAMLISVAWRGGLSRLATAGLVLCGLFWAYQFENFIVGFQHQFVGVYAAATAAVLVLAFRREEGVVPAILLGVASTWTMANGVLTGPTLVLLGFLIALPRKSIIWLCIGAAIMVCAFVIPPHFYPSQPGSTQQSAASLIETLRHPGKALLYFPAFFGAPFARLVFHGAIDSPASQAAAVMVGLIAAAGFLYVAVQLLLPRIRGQRPEAPEATFLGILIFVVASGLATAIGRAGADPIQQVGAGRYGTPVVVFWISLLLLCWNIMQRKGQVRLATLARWAVVGFCLLVAASQLILIRMVVTSPAEAAEAPAADKSHAVSYRLQARRMALNGILSDVYDPDVIDTVFNPEHHLPPGKLTDLRASNMAPFNVASNRWLGQQMAQHLAVTQACPGGASHIATIGQGAFRITGSMNSGKAPARVVLVSSRGLIVGYGGRNAGRSLGEAIKDSSPFWNGYARVMPGEVVTVYGFDPGTATACAIIKAPMPD